MSGVCRDNLDILASGGIARSIMQNSVYVNGRLVIVVGDYINGGSDECDGSILITGSTSVYINGKSVCMIGSEASCGEVMVTGSPNVFVGN